MKRFVLILTICNMFSCRIFEAERPSNAEIVEAFFLDANLKKANMEFEEWLDLSLKYVAPHILHIYRHNWKIVKPLLINSDYTRMVAFIPSWHYGSGKTHSSLIWALGFYTDNQWHFYMPNVTQYMSSKNGVEKDFDPLLWKTTKEEIEKYTRNYIKYDKDLKEWKINDRWFTGYFDNRDNLLLEHHWTLTDEEISDLPESYWIDRYLKMARIHTYKIAKTRKYWEEEDRKYSNKEISEEEWAIIQGRRNPRTSEGIRNVQRFYKDVLSDDNDTTYVNLVNDLAPDYKANLEKRRKRFGRKSQ